MTSTPAEIAKRLRPALTRLYLLYFRQATHSRISMAQLSIMMNLGEQGPLRISQIAATESIRMPTASNAVNQLDTMGLVTRVRDVSDRRGVRVKLTEEGIQELRRIGEERDEQLTHLIAGLDPDELAFVEQASPVIDLILERYQHYISHDVEGSAAAGHTATGAVSGAAGGAGRAGAAGGAG
ncbi:MarR family winged helix-turn-helix transcriptional regulator, partial [Corynebacterium bovis]